MVLILLTAILFTYGRSLAKQKRFEAHRKVQITAVILNSLVALSFMVGSFIRHILPGVPARLLEGDYGVSTLHALIGTTALLLGVFVVLRGNNLVPKSLRFRNYKPFMQASYTMYMLATLLGVTVVRPGFCVRHLNQPGLAAMPG